MIDELIKIRHYLHKYPELSGQEKETSEFIIRHLQETEPDELIVNIGGYGIAAVYQGLKEGRSIGIRVDIDALPIPERSDKEYRSSKQGVSHACGHDGHTTIGLGLAKEVSKRRSKLSGKVVIIFQPAEETGTGADLMLSDDRMKKIQFDYVYALHNLPGFEKNALILRDEVFASSSIGVKIYLTGTTSHAAHPENGNSPVLAMTSLIDCLNNLPRQTVTMHRPSLVTVIHARLGEVAFGTTPGEAVVMATLRAHYDSDLENMKERCEKITAGIAAAYDLKYRIEWVEHFPSLCNDRRSVENIRKAGQKLNLKIIEKEHPLSWTEDFAVFTKRYKGALFGLGTGLNHPQVHNDNYDFPDELLKTGIDIFLEIIEITLSSGG